MNPILQAAIEAHGRGWSIIPLSAGTKDSPGVAWKQFQTQRATIEKVRGWFGNGKPKNLAVVLGAVSDRLACRDFDAVASYERWAEAHGDLATTLPTVATSRGRHVYFRTDIDRAKALVGDKAYSALDDGELRLSACYCLLPPSQHPGGPVYRWENPPNGSIPLVDDVAAAGLAWSWSRNTVATESARELRNTQDVNDAVIGVSPGAFPSVLRDPVVLNAIEAAIVATLPKVIGHRHKKVFELCRALQGIPGLSFELFPDPYPLKPFVRRWHERACKDVKMRSFDGKDWPDFVSGWPGVKYPWGTEPIRGVFERAIRAKPPKSADEYTDEKLRLLVALCRELQQERGNRPFFLAARTAGELLTVDPGTACRWLKALCVDRILKLVTKGSLKDRKASEFLYLPND